MASMLVMRLLYSEEGEADLNLGWAKDPHGLPVHGRHLRQTMASRSTHLDDGRQLPRASASINCMYSGSSPMHASIATLMRFKAILGGPKVSPCLISLGLSRENLNADTKCR